MESLIGAFGGLAWTLLAFVVALSVIVAIHEYGHYIVGRWSGIYAEVFSIGFGPVLFSRTDRRGTRWQVAAIPAGGYVKFLGDANAASVGTDHAAMAGMGQDRRRHTMQGAPLWARAATVAAGPIFNFVFSILIFTGVALWSGQPSDPLAVESLRDVGVDASAFDIEAGDVPLAIAGQPLPDEDLGDWGEALPAERILGWTVLRDGGEVVVPGPHPFPPLVGGVQPRSAADDADLRPGDVIVAIDGNPIASFAQLRASVLAAGSDGLSLTVRRDGTSFETALAPRRMDVPLPEGGFETRWLIGVTGAPAFVPATESVGPWQALIGGAAQLWLVLRSSLEGLWSIVTGAISSCNLSGPVGIAETASSMASQGGQSFVWFVAVLSAAVGLLNLFPIPVLDGGTLAFHAYELATGRKPSDRALNVLMVGGLALIGTLMIFALFNDFVC
ncbi:regulator of sigma E protease [Hasllibacter halocynthiae]|uniref:Zinc metalloprotease n=1 Tax=Hasllibacter halocynthiae TaxID=595589 RepID=A0A2T0X816_9RHOB|nr:RIP metalloprotease RseP [Hasllibacter halocynthiae]PRY95092.1 regulator of sigma E protease [Hasllibacter halocynthiae]